MPIYWLLNEFYSVFCLFTASTFFHFALHEESTGSVYVVKGECVDGNRDKAVSHPLKLEVQLLHSSKQLGLFGKVIEAKIGYF